MASVSGTTSSAVIGRIRIPMARIVPSAAGSVARYHRGMATLSRADVEHVAHLARLGLTDEELGRLEGQLNHILDQYAILAEVPTDHIAPTAQTIARTSACRRFRSRTSSATPPSTRAT